jgi:hypothetical protein
MYVIKLGKLYDSNPHLRRKPQAQTSAKPLACRNAQLWSITFPYTNPGNLAFRWCSITVLGKFDFLQGGQIILWDLELVIDFSPGSTIIPSTVIHHSNTTIEATKTCYSFTQYATGGLFHWVRNGFCLEKMFLVQATKE